MNLYDIGADLPLQKKQFHAGTDTHAYRWLGCHYAGDNGYVFRVWAPNAKAVSLVGDFNGWNPDAQPMMWTDGGIWETAVQDIPLYAAYKYHIVGQDGNAVDKSDHASHSHFHICQQDGPRNQGSLRSAG